MMTMKRSSWSARRVHRVVAWLVSMPILVVAITGLLFALRGPWIMDLRVPVGWLAGYTPVTMLPIQAIAESNGGVLWVGTSEGLWRTGDGKSEREPSFVGQDVIGLATAKDGRLIVATRMAVWAEQDGAWTAKLRGRVRQLTRLPDGSVLAIAGGRGEAAVGKPMVTMDGRQWDPYPVEARGSGFPAPNDDRRVPLAQLLRDIHSGAAFFGVEGARWWSLALGWILVLLALTGLWLWRNHERMGSTQRAAGMGRQS